MALSCGIVLVAAVGGLTLSGGQAAGMGVSILLFASIAALAIRSVWADYPHDRFGLCNTVTLLRAALVAAVAAPLAAPPVLAEPAQSWAVLSVAVIALSLDGLDGWLARRSGLSSDFGARFDMEVDSLLGLILALLAVAGDKAGLWLLALGGMRYAYVAAGLALPWIMGALPQRFRRKTVCVIQIAVLIVLIAPGVTPPLSTGLAVSATLLLAWSFAVDIVWLARRR